jgi:hypothetical protein
LSAKLLSSALILEALELLADELPSGEPVEILVGGGAALVLLYGAREATKDVDALAVITVEPATVRSAAVRVADRMGLPEDWLYEKSALTVRAVAPRQLLAMKLSAWRDDIDIADARLLLSKVPGTGAEVWKSIEPYLVPGRELKARYAFEDLWELEHGPA